MPARSLNPLAPFIRYLRPYRLTIAAGFFCILGAQGLNVLGPLVMERTVDAITGQQPRPGWATDLVLGIRGRAEATLGGRVGDISFYAALFLCLALSQGALRFGMRRIINGMSRYVEYDIRNDYFAHLLKLPLAYFQKTPTGDLMARATNDLEAVRMFLGMGLMFMMEAVIIFSASLYVMLTIHVPLTVFALLPLPLLSFLVNRLASRVHHRFREIQEHFSLISARVQENLAGMRVVKAYVQEEQEQADFRRLNDVNLEKNRALIVVRSFFFPLMFAMGGTCIAIILWLGGREVIRGEITLGQFVAFNAYLTMLIFPMIALGWVTDLYQRGTASMKRINAVLETEPEIRDRGADREIQALRGEIEFRDLTFAYGDRPVLQDIDLKIPAGTVVGLVGRVGCGKTTLARLIPRLIEAGEGQVRIDGVPIGRIPLNVLRRNIGYVPQETFLFSDTLRENVAFGGSPEENEAVQWASDVAQLSKDVAVFPEGFETVVGERGVTLSGGQRQRTALARAILRRPQILILDDALSSVDTHTEEEILRGLREVMKGRTCLVIAHRISTVKDSDLIVVLDEGRIAEQGTHHALVARGGLYAEMVQRQTLMSDLEKM
ncbi:MAG: ABC transporter ATP-binding protein [Candidatus Latescibacteria bacterium]|nr:ABC transporter ATP-binding protein [Candidatus Latescibacterota bacterium]